MKSGNRPNENSKSNSNVGRFVAIIIIMGIQELSRIEDFMLLYTVIITYGARLLIHYFNFLPFSINIYNEQT
jgi:hypothetical protein